MQRIQESLKIYTKTKDKLNYFKKYFPEGITYDKLLNVMIDELLALEEKEKNEKM